MATTVFRGANLNWGTIPSGSITVFGTCYIQTANSVRTGDEFELKDEVGDQRSWVGYGLKSTCTFIYYAAASGSTNVGTCQVVAPTFGQLATISSGPEVKGFVTGSMIVKDVTVNTSNTDAVKVDVAGTFYPYITS